MERSNFKVVIVGGSIAGLTLAHCLAKAGIDHVVLEKRTDIAPQEGAFVGVWPNGARVLQQLGVYPHLETLAEPLSQMHVTFPDGFAFRSLLPKAVHEKFDYPIVSLCRQKVLEILYKCYPAKENIIAGKRVTEVRFLEKGASVLTDDGSQFEADLVVGADGVHSRIRSEMWRLAESMNPGSIPQSEKTSLTIEYVCVFGISSAIPGLESGEHINRYGDKFCVMTFHGKYGRVFWFILYKLEKAYSYPNAPRYSPEDAARICEELASVYIFESICVRDLWETREVVSMTAAEEGFFDIWHFRRVVLLGDSIHKMTPNIGQGANTAIEDAAVLASLINRLARMNKAGTISEANIVSMLQEYQGRRYARGKNTYLRSRFGARLHTRDDWIKALAGRYLLPYIGSFVERKTTGVLAHGDFVDFLPLPQRSGSGWTNKCIEEQKPHSAYWRLLWISPLAFCWVFFYIKPCLDLLVTYL